MTPSNEFKHKAEIPKRFTRSFKPLSEEMKQRVMKKIQELAMGHITGKPLVGKYKNHKRIKIGKYRLIHGEKPCVIYLYDIKPRETAYI
jgi:mRNA-degrading endonuclease RelE of RelBE toxin-antitoxin system